MTNNLLAYGRPEMGMEKRAINMKALATKINPMRTFHGISKADWPKWRQDNPAVWPRNLTLGALGGGAYMHGDDIKEKWDKFEFPDFQAPSWRDMTPESWHENIQNFGRSVKSLPGKAMDAATPSNIGAALPILAMIASRGRTGARHIPAYLGASAGGYAIGSGYEANTAARLRRIQGENKAKAETDAYLRDRRNQDANQSDFINYLQTRYPN